MRPAVSDLCRNDYKISDNVDIKDHPCTISQKVAGRAAAEVVKMIECPDDVLSRTRARRYKPLWSVGKRRGSAFLELPLISSFGTLVRTKRVELVSLPVINWRLMPSAHSRCGLFVPPLSQQES